MSSTESKNEYAEIPISEGIIGMDENSVIRATTELYIPKKYKDLSCKVEKITQQFDNMKQVRVTIDFLVTGNVLNDFKYYENEEFWKAYTLKYFFENTPPLKRKIKYAVPIIGFMLNKYLKVEKVIDISNKEEVPFDQSIDTVFSYDSVKPRQVLDVHDSYVYYNKKTTFIYDDLIINKKYTYEVTLISEGVHFEFGLLFPFGIVQCNSTEGFSNSDIEIKTFIYKISPITSKELPPLVLEKMKRYLPESYNDRHYPTHMKPALTYRGDDVLFPPDGTYGSKKIGLNDKIPKDYLVDINEPNPWKLSNFEALRFTNMIIFPPNKDLDIIITVQEQEISSRIYEQLQSMSNHYEDVLISFDIFNIAHKKRRLRLEAEIEGYTSCDKKTVFVHGLNDNHRKVRVQTSLCPRMKRGVLQTIKNPEKATLLARVIDEDTKVVLVDRTFPVTLLPEDHMVWSLRSTKNSKMFNLSKFIASWIYPKDVDGEFDRIRSGAVKYHPNNCFSYNNTETSLLEHVKAIYEYLAKDIGIKYINQPFNSFNQFDSQRVVLPEQSVKNKAGNCIDLTVLFASILEGFGIQSLIFITKDHAFIGWGNPKSIHSMIALETTVIGKATFEEALKIGEEQIKKNYLFSGAKDLVPMFMIYKSFGSCIISLEKCRNEGIAVKL
ncbi:MAG TPA: hypothetical protein VK153_02370 [Candidatus Paceibacterota bacterium]|nr:hypothetical protein [Candidatus Paceibacterota bacterium]